MRGLSLLEILIVLTLIAVTAVIAIPQLMQLSDRNEAELFKNKFMLAIEAARMQASIKEQNVGICKSANDLTCTSSGKKSLLIFLDNNENGVITYKQQILAVIPWGSRTSQLNWRSFPFYRDYLLFIAGTQLKNDNGTVWYCTKNHANPFWALVINKAGRARILNANTDGVIADNKGRPLVC